jgi:hypothetical protein
VRWSKVCSPNTRSRPSSTSPRTPSCRSRYRTRSSTTATTPARRDRCSTARRAPA